MATKLILRESGTFSTRRPWSGDTSSSPAAGATNGWLVTSAGGAAQSAQATTITGPGEVIIARFVSIPVAATINITSNPTFNLWGFEASMNANATLRVKLYRLRPNSLISLICTGTGTVELGTTTAVLTGSFTGVSSVTMQPGDCLGVEVSLCDAPATVMASGFAVTLRYNNPTAAADGDSYITLVETLSMLNVTPSGPFIYFTNTDSDIVVGGESAKLLQVGGSAPSAWDSATTTPTGPTAPVRITDTAGGSPLVFFTNPLNSFSDGSGNVGLQLDAYNSAPNGVASKCEVYVCNGDGSSPSLVNQCWFGGSLLADTSWGITAATVPFYFNNWAAFPIAWSQGQRLMIKLYLDDALNVGPTQVFGGTGALSPATGGNVLTHQMGNALFRFQAGTITEAPTIPVDRPGTIATNWGTWSATGTGNLSFFGTISTSWGTWATTVTGVRTTAATIATSWGTWTATGAGAPDRAATIATSWGTWTTTALASAIEHPATVATSWGTWSTTVTAVRTTAATVSTSWGTWTATATATRTTAATAVNAWGTWTASATGTVSAGITDIPATISSAWGTWTATTGPATIEHAATVATAWGTWAATATATRETAASVATSWGTWVSTVTGVRTTAATVTTAWGTWTGTATATPDHVASVTTSWGTWTTTVTAVRTTAATVTTSWGTWAATATASLEHPASVATNWGTWTSSAMATPEVSSVIITDWGTWATTATAVRTTAATATTTWSTWTATATGTVARNVPQDVVATPTGKTTISVTWTTFAGATAYDIERDGLVIVSDHPASPFNDTGLTPNTLYSYRVRAVL